MLDNIRIAQFAQIRYGVVDSILHTRRYRDEEKEIKKRSLELLEVFELRHLADEIVANLPYGQQREVEIVRALATKPRLLLLDEPAAGMNPGEIDTLLKLIQWIRKEFDLTIWIIEHQMRVIMGICERIKVIDFGETIAEGTPAEIQSNPRVLKAYLGEEGI